jgi:hypothetical protein
VTTEGLAPLLCSIHRVIQDLSKRFYTLEVSTVLNKPQSVR